MASLVDDPLENYFRRHGGTGLNGIDCIDLDRINQEIAKEEQKFNEIIEKIARGEEITTREKEYMNWYLRGSIEDIVKR